MPRHVRLLLRPCQSWMNQRLAQEKVVTMRTNAQKVRPVISTFEMFFIGEGDSVKLLFQHNCRIEHFASITH